MKIIEINFRSSSKLLSRDISKKQFSLSQTHMFAKVTRFIILNLFDSSFRKKFPIPIAKLITIIIIKKKKIIQFPV